MKIGRHKISESEAISAAIEYAVKVGKKGEINFSEVEEKSGEWLLRGTCGDDEEPTLAEAFTIEIDGKGKVKSSDFSPETQKKAPEEENHNKFSSENLKEDRLSDTLVSGKSLEEKESSEKQKVNNSVFSNDYQQTVEKIESLQSAITQLALEREKLQKKLKAKVSSLELEIKGIESEIKRIKLFLKQEKYDEPSNDLEMQIAQAQ